MATAPNPSPVYRPPEVGRPPGGRRKRWLTGLVIAPFILLVLLPVLSLWWQQEIPRWQVLAAREEQLNGDLPAGIEILDAAIEQRPDDFSLRIERARYKLELKDATGALVDLDYAINLDPEATSPRVMRSGAYRMLDQPRKAIAEWDYLVEKSRSVSNAALARNLNGRAYLKALCNFEINSGIKDVDRALKYAGDNYAMLDTRGFLYYLADDPDLLPKAKADLDKAVNAGERELIEILPMYDKLTEMQIDQREANRERQRFMYGVAVLRYHRGLVFQKLGEEVKARQDMERARSLGLDPDDPQERIWQ